MRTKAPHHLLALGSAAVMAVYGAGFLKTRAAAAKFSDAPAMRRPVATVPPAAATGEPVSVPAPTTLEPASMPSAVPSMTPPPTSAPVANTSAAPKAATMTSRSAPTASAPASAPSADATSSMTTAGPAPVVPAPVVDVPAPVDAASLTAPTAPVPAPVKAKYKDGTYLGYGTSRHGDIQAKVVIANDRIVSTSISKCLTQYSCDWIAMLPGQVVTRQSAEVDFVSGATQSTNAFYYAVLEALAIAQNR